MEEFFQILNIDHVPGIFQQLPFPLFQLMDQLRSGFFLFQLSDLFLISCTYIFFCLCKKLVLPRDLGARINAHGFQMLLRTLCIQIKGTNGVHLRIEQFDTVWIVAIRCKHIQDPAADTVFASSFYHGNSFISL